MVFGSVGWDRPIWLDQPLKSGARLLGLIDSEDAFHLPQGRLGGAASNASACLINAGHHVAVWSAVRDDETGAHVRAALLDLGVDTSNLSVTETIPGQTMILIEPNGERTIFFQHADPDLNRTIRHAMKRQAAKIDIAKVSAFRPEGILLRALFSNYADLSALSDVISVGHWPQSSNVAEMPADVLIGSRDDLKAYGLLEDAFQHAKKACGNRLKWIIVTDGKSGGEIFGEAKRFAYSSPVIHQIDATGAGDSFAAGVLEALVKGADIVEAAHHGASWGAKTASLRGSAEIRPTGTYTSWNAVEAPAR